MTTTRKPLFNPGPCYATPGALEALEDAAQNPATFLDRHVCGDWGEVCKSDQRANNTSLIDGSRLLSAYRTSKGIRLWIITEGEDDDGVRSHTTILLPEEY